MCYQYLSGTNLCSKLGRYIFTSERFPKIPAARLLPQTQQLLSNSREVLLGPVERLQQDAFSVRMSTYCISSSANQLRSRHTVSHSSLLANQTSWFVYGAERLPGGSDWRERLSFTAIRYKHKDCFNSLNKLMLSWPALYYFDINSKTFCIKEKNASSWLSGEANKNAACVFGQKFSAAPPNKFPLLLFASWTSQSLTLKLCCSSVESATESCGAVMMSDVSTVCLSVCVCVMTSVPCALLCSFACFKLSV